MKKRFHSCPLDQRCNSGTSVNNRIDFCEMKINNSFCQLKIYNIQRQFHFHFNSIQCI
jgi:hypothetical protein